MGRARMGLVVVAVVAMLAACGSSHSTRPVPHRDPGKQRTFATPVPRSGACGMVARVAGLTTEVECLVFPAPRLPAHMVGTVYLYASGRVKLCRGEGCLGNPEPRWTLSL